MHIRHFVSNELMQRAMATPTLHPFNHPVQNGNVLKKNYKVIQVSKFARKIEYETNLLWKRSTTRTGVAKLLATSFRSNTSVSSSYCLYDKSMIEILYQISQNIVRLTPSHFTLLPSISAVHKRFLLQIRVKLLSFKPRKVYSGFCSTISTTIYLTGLDSETAK